MASAPFLELLGLRNRAGWSGVGEGGGVLMMMAKKQGNGGNMLYHIDITVSPPKEMHRLSPVETGEPRFPGLLYPLNI